MGNYKYIARDTSGARKKGAIQAGCSGDALTYLREQGLTPVSVNETAKAAKPAKQKSGRRKKIKSAELAALCWQLTTMVEGGVSITAGIETIAEDVENIQLQEILLEILEKMNKGETLSDSISGYPKVFNSLACAMVLAGETGGNLPVTLRRLAEYFDNRDRLAKKVKGAMAYPIFVVVFIVLIVIFIMAFIIPRFRVIFDQLGGELPAFTRAFMGFYDMLRYNLIYIIGGVSLLVGSIVMASKTQKGHHFLCRISLGIPLIGKVIKQAFVAVFCRTMATLIGAGVSVLEIFDILSTMTDNDIIRNAVVQTKEHIVGGANISAGMKTSGFFPNMVVKMIQVGEQSGSLTGVLDRTADYYERKIDAMITMLMGLLEPIMIVTVGGIVLVVILALYLPIFSMSSG